MKTKTRILIGITAVVLAGATAINATAGTCVSFGFGYRGGHRHHWGVGYSSYYCPPPVYYYAPRPVYYVPPPPPPPPPVVYRAPAPNTQPLGVSDIKALTKAEISDEVIISQIRNSRTVFRLTTAEIIDLKESGVSQRVIDAMINTSSGS
ncbi:MAG: hypothetical protein FJ395_19360 [Verrucomicrobia bacterium]|nr:hypothetical protein [Verrucomicrobiota bacterium]